MNKQIELLSVTDQPISATFVPPGGSYAGKTNSTSHYWVVFSIGLMLLGFSEPKLRGEVRAHIHGLELSENDLDWQISAEEMQRCMKELDEYKQTKGETR